MRKIEQQMLVAIRTRKNWHLDNTCVLVNDDYCVIFLHGNRIAEFNNNTGELTVIVETLKAWQTPTTKSRLRALGANVTTRKGVTYLDNVAV
jgi:hypothetical protein